MSNEVCENGAVRLQGGPNEFEGRVKVCRSQEWGTVCDNMWGIADAKVVCRQLEFSSASM